VEKAFAKHCAGYPNLKSGLCSEALALLTGWPTYTIEFDEELDQQIL